jgi:hypothetical protein
VAELPKTRSGKIMRRLLKDVAEDRAVGDTTTLADSTVIDLIKAKPPQAAGSDASLAAAASIWGVPIKVARKRRRLTAELFAGSCFLMIPWIVYLAFTLPVTYRAEAWKASWVGFDVLLLAALAATGWSSWKQRQTVVTFALVTATLLVCDAWFDITLDWGTTQVWTSIASAVFLELPLAWFFASRARHIMKLTVRLTWNRAGVAGEPPPLHNLPLFIVPQSKSSSWQNDASDGSTPGHRPQAADNMRSPGCSGGGAKRCEAGRSPARAAGNC